jgi:hypothetical protein
MQPFTKVWALIEIQPKVMEIDLNVPRPAEKKRRAIMDRVTLLDKGIHIPYPN